MDQIDRTKFFWPSLLAILLILVLASHYLERPVKITTLQRQEALSRSRIIGIYATIRQLEDDRGKLIARIVEEQNDSTNVELMSSTNLNGLVYNLIEKDHLVNLSLLPSTNIDGIQQFVDVWGHPYDIRLAPAMGTNYGEIERRVLISSPGHIQ